MRLWIPKADIPVTPTERMGAEWYKFLVGWFNATPNNTGNITADTTIKTSGRYTVDTSGGDVTITPQAFPVTLVKTVAANDVVIAGLTVNGNASFSWATQWQSYTIDVIDGVGVAY